MRPLHALVIGSLALALVAAGCGASTPSSNGDSATNGDSVTLKLASSNIGRFLADAQGHALYLFEKDTNGESRCSGACAAAWPPFKTDATPHASAGVDAAALGTTKRDDGDMQVTYHGHPLYYYAADAGMPGKTRGEDVKAFGASWYLVDAAGKPVEPESGAESDSNPSPQSGGGGGYYR